MKAQEIAWFLSIDLFIYFVLTALVAWILGHNISSTDKPMADTFVMNLQTVQNWRCHCSTDTMRSLDF